MICHHYTTISEKKIWSNFQNKCFGLKSDAYPKGKKKKKERKERKKER